MDWNYIDKGCARTLAYLPGWATDARMLPVGDLEWNTLIPEGPLTGLDDLTSLAEAIERHSLPVTLLGWSMGACLAVDFASTFPGRCSRFVLASLSPTWPREHIVSLRAGIGRDKRATLRTFYRRCGYPSSMAEYRHFRATLEDATIERLDSATLLAGLDYLESFTLAAARVPASARIIHGRDDIVSPLASALPMAAECSLDVRVIDDAAHMILSRREVTEFLNAP